MIDNDNNMKDATWHPAILRGAQETSLYSSITDKDYRIQIAPVGSVPSTGYPVVFCLDGDFMLPLALLLLQSATGPNSQKDDKKGFLLVGIGYHGDGFYDTVSRADDYLPHQNHSSIDGAEKFYNFIENELKSYIVNHYQIDADNYTLVGHSFGGLCALYNAFVHTDSFNHYVISSPSLWWDDKKILQFEDSMRHPPSTLLLSSAEYEQKPHSNDDPERVLRKQEYLMVDNAQKLYQRLSKKFPKEQFPQLELNFSLYENETHGSVIPRVLIDQLGRVIEKIFCP